MYKIKVKPEGRKDVWIPKKSSLKKFIKAKKFKTIHNYIPMERKDCMLMVGADHEICSVLEDIDKADRLAIFTDKTFNCGYSLAIIYKNELQCYDIGNIKIKHLEITSV